MTLAGGLGSGCSGLGTSVTVSTGGAGAASTTGRGNVSVGVDGRSKTRTPVTAAAASPIAQSVVGENPRDGSGAAMLWLNAFTNSEAVDQRFPGSLASAL